MGQFRHSVPTDRRGLSPGLVLVVTLLVIAFVVGWVVFAGSV